MHPYAQLPPQSFWRSGVAQSNPARIEAVFHPKFPIGPTDAIGTVGSCFAQHIGRRLRRAGLNVLDLEPAPDGAPLGVLRNYGYGIFSARYGNIYTVRQLVQLLDDARAGFVDPCYVWQRNGRFYDAFRPGIEPGGLASLEEVLALRRFHLGRVARLFAQASCLFFTLGLTECWIEQATGRVLPICPGVIAGEYDPDHHALLSLGWAEVMADLAALWTALRGFNPKARLVLSVSPVPLTATATGGHVLVATGQAKAVLRAAAGEFAARHADVDYFPSYEIITNPAAMGSFFRPNLREIADRGVDAVMSMFLEAHGLSDQGTKQVRGDSYREDDINCDEILHEAAMR